MNHFSKIYKIKQGQKVKLSQWDPGSTGNFKEKSEAQVGLQKSVARLAELQYLLFAENKHALLIVFQAMDAGGKDGTIRQVMSNVDPQSCKVTSFKAPSTEDLAHDFLWRIHKAVPSKGEIGIFNRSHYEDVLVARVRNLVPKSVWMKRYEQINSFEEILAQNNVTILKFFLHISKDEQKKRLQERIDNPAKNWKINLSDFEDRKHWNDYVKAYEDLLTKCSTGVAPWFIIPADKKWFRNLVVSQIVNEALENLKMKSPPPAYDLSKIVLK